MLVALLISSPQPSYSSLINTLIQRGGNEFIAKHYYSFAL